MEGFSSHVSPARRLRLSAGGAITLPAGGTSRRRLAQGRRARAPGPHVRLKETKARGGLKVDPDD